MTNNKMLILNAAIICAAVIINFINKGFNSKRWKYQLLAVLFVSPLFWILAALSVKLETVLKASPGISALFGVPLYYYVYLAALVFFSVSLLELVKKYIIEKVTILPRFFFLFPAAVFIIPAIIFHSRTWTCIVLLCGAAVFIFAGIARYRLLQSGRFTAALGLSTVLFCIAEIVRSNSAFRMFRDEVFDEKVTWGITFLNTIPEDLILVFSIAGAAITVYSLLSWDLQYERNNS